MVLVIFITRFLAFFLQNTHTVQSNAFKVLHTSLSLLFMVDPVRSLSSASYRKSGSMSNGWNCQYWWNPLKAVVGKSSRQLPPPWKSGLQRLGTKERGGIRREKLKLEQVWEIEQKQIGTFLTTVCLNMFLMGFSPLCMPVDMKGRHQNVNVQILMNSCHMQSYDHIKESTEVQSF